MTPVRLERFVTEFCTVDGFPVISGPYVVKEPRHFYNSVSRLLERLPAAQKTRNVSTGEKNAVRAPLYYFRLILGVDTMDSFRRSIWLANGAPCSSFFFLPFTRFTSLLIANTNLEFDRRANQNVGNCTFLVFYDLSLAFTLRPR